MNPNRELYEAWQNGKSLEQLAEMRGVSVSRIRQLLSREKEIVFQISRRNASGGWRNWSISDCFELSPRIRHSLRNEGIGTLGEAQERMMEGAFTYRKRVRTHFALPNFGPKSLQELEDFISQARSSE